MTTNQTIDGVPRKWLEEYEVLADLTSGDAQKLRALLDAPAIKPRPFGYWLTPKTCAGLAMFQRELIEDPVLTESVVEYFHIKPLYDTPAEQPQGDTVPVSAHWSDWSMVTLEVEGRHRTYVEYGEPKAKPVAWKTGSITWAYEPDARRHGEQHGVLVKPLFDRPDCREPDYYRIKTPKTLVNGVPTEWFPAVMFYAKSELPKDGMYRVIERLYAEQPAPVAMPRLEMAHVVRAHMEITGCPVLTSNQCHALAMKLNACLDEVKRLNP